MKKLMIAALVAVCGVAANAATVSWSIDESYIGKGDFTVADAADGYHAFVMVSSGTFLEGFGEAYAVSLAKTDLENGDVSFLSNALKYEDGTVAKPFVYGAAMGTVGFDEGAANGVLGNSQDVALYVVLLDNADPTKATRGAIADLTEMSETPIATINNIGGSDTVSFGYIEYTDSPSVWYAVPEPTSGLLLLLGVAGLALRRRRA